MKTIVFSAFLFLFTGTLYAQHNNGKLIGKQLSQVTAMVQVVQTPKVVQIKKPSFIFFIPDKSTIDSLKRAQGEDGFETVIEDNSYQDSEAKIFLEKQKTMREQDAGITDNLEFFKSNGTIVRINLKKLNKIWGIVLFDGKNDPVITTSTNVETDYKKYFKTK